MLLLWIFVPLVCGWRTKNPEDVFLQMARQEIDSFHRILFYPDSYPLASHLSHEAVAVKDGKGGGEANHEGMKDTGEKKSSSGDSKSHSQEAVTKGHAEKEMKTKTYGEESGKKGETHSKHGQEGEHHSSHGGEQIGGFKDRLLHKKGNYEKGYRDKYHLDEVSKHDKFWSNHHSIDKFHNYGKHGSYYHKKHQDQSEKGHKEAGEQKNTEGKKGESVGGHSESEDKGHMSKGGAESKYEHKEEYEKKKDKPAM